MALRVLVIDDDLAVQELLAEYLRGRGADVLVGEGVASALQALLKGVDALVTELDLPDGNGVELLRAARIAGLPGIVVTAPGAAEDIVLAFREGAVDVLLKPFSLKQLYERLERAAQGAAVGKRARLDRARLGVLESALLARTPEEVQAARSAFEKLAREGWSGETQGPEEALPAALRACRRALAEAERRVAGASA